MPASEQPPHEPAAGRAVGAEAEAAVPLLTADLAYELPDGAIAQSPIVERDRTRLLVDLGNGIAHHRVHDLPDLIRPGDLLVVNDTRVMPARLRLRRSSGGRAEILLLEYRGNGAWEALARPSRRLKPGEKMGLADDWSVEIGEDLGRGRRIVRLTHDAEESPAPRSAAGAGGSAGTIGLLNAVGEVPLPPYINAPLDDAERYQTVFARRPVSAAAPTAGLHLTLDLLDRVQSRGAEVAAIELAVGLDTFRPMTAQLIADHEMHSERYRVPASTAAAIASARRVVAVGTTVVRALETFARTGESESRSDLFIRRPFDWQTIDVLLTNFHAPRSSLLCLVDAFIGPRWRDLYTEALADGYRFLSFGDAMLLARTLQHGGKRSQPSLPGQTAGDTGPGLN